MRERSITLFAKVRIINIISKRIMGRRTEGQAVIADYSVWTVELSRDELMIILDGQKNHRINRAKRKLQFLRAQRDHHRGYGRMRNKQINK